MFLYHIKRFQEPAESLSSQKTLDYFFLIISLHFMCLITGFPPSKYNNFHSIFNIKTESQPLKNNIKVSKNQTTSEKHLWLFLLT